MYDLQERVQVRHGVELAADARDGGELFDAQAQAFVRQRGAGGVVYRRSQLVCGGGDDLKIVFVEVSSVSSEHGSD